MAHRDESEKKIQPVFWMLSPLSNFYDNFCQLNLFFYFRKLKLSLISTRLPPSKCYVSDRKVYLVNSFIFFFQAQMSILFHRKLGFQAMAHTHDSEEKKKNITSPQDAATHKGIV